MISGSDDNTIKIWDLRSGKLVKTKNDALGRINDLQFHPKDMLFAAASQVEFMLHLSLTNRGVLGL